MYGNEKCSHTYNYWLWHILQDDPQFSCLDQARWRNDFHWFACVEAANSKQNSM